MLLEQGIMGVFINPPYSGSNLSLPASHFDFDAIVHFTGNDTPIPGSSPSTSLHLGRSPNRNIMAHSLSHRSEEHTSELQSRGHLVCRLLLEKKKKKKVKQ